MPIISSIPISPLTQDEFRELSYEVMRHVFAIHNEFGRFFCETVYKRELALRMTDVRPEVAIDVVHGTFEKRYFADMIVRAGGLFEFKAAAALQERHRAQAINYLLLFGLHHAKLINMRPEKVQHEFVNCRRSLADLQHPQILCDGLRTAVPGSTAFCDTLVSLVRDWGTCLELQLYSDALLHLFDEQSAPDRQISVIGRSGVIAEQEMKLVAPEVAFSLTALSDREEIFLTHARRLLDHTSLRAIQWANMTPHCVRFMTIQ